ncbi:enoyl-CoA hydratase/isomerase family protein [Rhodococcus sp. NPDC019647]|uniref:enoyl-CoA hydratase/isomerase family protein n=3 Tax=Rhodococcus TaxID=1827 RepID=UPI0037B7C39D
MSETTTTTPEVLISTSGGVGRLVLNRPKAINALNHGMVGQIAAALAAWSDDDEVRAVVLTGAGERGLCAGGDIVSIYHDAQEGGTGSREFWRDEYILNAAIARYRKPYVAIMDGIVMGGGVGVSAHGSVRVVTERSMIGMPETGIGFVPDVGGTYLLARTPGELGTHIALTTARLSAGDAIACGFADHYIPSAKIEQFVQKLSDTTVEEALAAFTEPAPPSELLAQQGWIDAAYSAGSVPGIIARLRGSGVPEAEKAAEQILSKSPTACAVTLQSLRRARAAGSLEEVLNEEFRVSVACLSSPDLVEGIRAQVVEKDRNPQWSPATIDEVTDEQVEAFFAPLGDLELGLTPPTPTATATATAVPAASISDTRPGGTAS